MLPQFRKPETDSPQSNISNLSAPPSTLGPRQTAASFRPGGPSGASVIGVDLVIHGNLTSKGEVQIEGEVQGDIHGTHVVIGERARVTGGVIAEECVIRGHLLGTVRGRRVLLQSSSHVEGDIFHPFKISIAFNKTYQHSSNKWPPLDSKRPSALIANHRQSPTLISTRRCNTLLTA